MLGLGSTVVTIWDIVKWPVIVILISLLLAVLYWAAPNARHGGFRWITPGGMLAVLVWLIASGGFALYVANFNNYSATYGTLGAVIILMLWFYLTGAAILVGGEVNSEIEKAAAKAGEPEAKLPGEKSPGEKGREEREGAALA